MPRPYEDPKKKYESYTDQELNGEWLRQEHRRKRLEQEYHDTPTTDDDFARIESEYFRASREQDVLQEVGRERRKERDRIDLGKAGLFEKQARQEADIYRETQAEQRKVERKRAKAYHKQQARLRREQRHDQ